MFELYIKTVIGNGVAVPKGRYKLPREAKPKAEETILVFAEGRLADEARRAGAHIVGGLDLVDKVRSSIHSCIRNTAKRSLLADSREQNTCNHLHLYPSLPSCYHPQARSVPRSPGSHALRKTWYRNRQHQRLHGAFEGHQ